MRAIQIDRTGGPDVLQLVDAPLADPGPGEVRVRHRAVGLNFVDIYFRTGLYKMPLPGILGSEGAGVIEAVGAGVDDLAVGDRVAYAASSQGSYAEARVVSATQVVRLPDTIEDGPAAAMMLKGLTVQYLLRRTRHGANPGDAIVWHAAAGGVGLIACQWASSLGYQVIATAGSPEKCQLALAHGAAHAIDYRTDDVVARVKELTGGRGVPAVFDPVGKDTWERSLDCLAPLGTLVLFGNASGPVPPFAPGILTQKGSLYVTRPSLNTHTATRAAVIEMAGELFGAVESGKVKVPVEREYALEDARKAHEDLEARVTTGAGVLIP